MKILKRIQNLISTKSSNTENLHIPQARLNSSIQTGFFPAPKKTELPAIIICLDVSPSMDYRDFEPSRLAAVKVAAKQFADNIQMTAPNTEIGIIGFSWDAQIALPLSDVKTYLPLIKSSIGDSQPAPRPTYAPTRTRKGHAQGNIQKLYISTRSALNRRRPQLQR